ncbi:MAG TPA: zf-HC2 domain-containing protein [Methylophaga aminisulfidivorans]|uniref:Zf-HC2 domain-containing protein n=2 Tax=root TaxID=1 RepID=A0A7C1ZQP9_9GAMM|nr:zf-HC2 domain-containing protein [Methylophaga aminisulfidivorans]
MFQCKDVAEEASNYLDGDLPLKKRIGILLHLMICRCCRNYLQQIRKTIKTITNIYPKEQHNTDVKSLAEKLRNLPEN